MNKSKIDSNERSLYFNKNEKFPSLTGGTIKNERIQDHPKILGFAYFSGFVQFVRQNVLYKKFKRRRINFFTFYLR